MIPDGAAGIDVTLGAMSAYVQEYKKSIAVRECALRLTGSLMQKDWASELTALHGFVRDYIRYVNDPVDVELVQTPDKTLEYEAGDCDDKCTLLAALLESIGHPTRFVAIGFQRGIYSHVYVECNVNDVWYPLETTEPVEAGWGPGHLPVACEMIREN